MKTKRFFLAALTVMCVMAITSVFAGCSSDDDEEKTYSYAIGYDNVSYASITDLNDPNAKDAGITAWLNSITNAYESALGVTSDRFTRTGKQDDCDKQVAADCKKAEETVKNIRGGSILVIVTNTTTGKRVYSYQVQP